MIPSGRKMLVMELDRRDKLPFAESPPARLHVGTLTALIDGKATVDVQGRILDEVTMHGTAEVGQGVFVLFAGNTTLVIGAGEGDAGGGGGSYLPLAGGTLTGPLYLPAAAPTAPTEAVNKSYVDSTFLKLSGGTMTGPINLSGLPTAPSHAASKEYVDSIPVGELTVVVAASNASTRSKDKADFVCDGTDDDVTIQAAFASLGSQGGKVVLSEGLFHFGTVGVITPAVPFHLHGMGQGATELISDTLGTAYMIRVGTTVNEQKQQMISDLTLNGADKAVSGIVTIQAVNNTVRLENLIVHDFTSHGVSTLARPAGAWKFRRCHFYANGGAGSTGREANVDYVDCIFQSNAGGGLGIQQDGTGHITDCLFWANTGNGISSGNAISQGFSSFVISNNIFLSNTGWGINIQDGNFNQISDNVFSGNTSGSISLGAGGFGVTHSGLVSNNNQTGTGTFIQISSGSDAIVSCNVVNGILTDCGDDPPDPATLGYVHVQGVAASFWTINHPLTFQPNVAVLDSTGEQVEGDVDYVDSDTITVGFSAAFSGIAYLS